MWFSVAVCIIFTVLSLISEKNCVENNLPPWNTLKIKANYVVLNLYNRENVGEPLNLPQNIKEVDFDKDLKIVIHGFFENSNSLWYKSITTEYLKKGDFNIIQVDWSGPASATYPASSRNTQAVGQSIGHLISNLYNNYNLSLEKVHVIGHSLGAHVAGHAGKEVVKRLGYPIFRITALDAAGPLFEGPALMYEGISKFDANIVDAIHTDGGVFGRRNYFADVDFFPNGGVPPQPGCDLINLLFSMNNYAGLKHEVLCSHTKSYHYFIASINQETFIGVKCNSWNDYILGKCYEGPSAVMGDDYIFSNSTTGSFYLRTNSRPPFARN